MNNKDQAALAVLSDITQLIDDGRNDCEVAELREARTHLAQRIEAAVRLADKFAEAHAHIAVAVMQLAPSDDWIISEHLREAERVSTAALADFQQDATK